MDVIRVTYEIDTHFPDYEAPPRSSESDIKKKKSEYEIIKKHIISNLEKWRASDTAWLSHAVSNYAKVKKEYKERGLLSNPGEINVSPDLTCYFNERGNTYPYRLFPNHTSTFNLISYTLSQLKGAPNTPREKLISTKEGRSAILEWEEEREKRRAIYHEFYSARHRINEVNRWIMDRSRFISFALKNADMEQLDSMEEHMSEMISMWKHEDEQLKYK